MIKAFYSKDDEGNYTRLEVSGHALSNEYGKDLICAAVSSIIFGFMNALSETREDVEIKELTNKIIIINQSTSQKIQDYFEVILTQLKTLEESYSEFIRVERK